MSKNFRAYAAGVIAPAGHGLPGPGASAWEIHDDIGTVMERQVKVGRDANRWPAQAQWAAIRGIVESPYIADGSTIEVWVQAKEIRDVVRNNFVLTTGRPAANREWWEPVHLAITRRKLRLTLWADKAELTLSCLVADAARAAQDRLAEIGPARAERDALAVPTRPKKPPKGFPPIHD